jgi:predicted outer membrane protein
LGGLSAFALAAWVGWMPAAPRSAPAPHDDSLVQPIGRASGVAVPEPPDWPAEVARRFIVEAAGGSLYDAQAARLVHAGSADAAVQALAATLLHDHEAAWPALRALAQRHGVALPEVPTPEQRAVLALLRDVAEHTRAQLFVRHVGVEATLAEIARFEAALEALDDADAALRDWIEHTLPSLRERAARSQRLLPQVAGRRPMA